MKVTKCYFFVGATRSATVANTNVAKLAALTLTTSVKCLATSNSPVVSTGEIHLAKL